MTLSPNVHVALIAVCCGLAMIAGYQLFAPLPDPDVVTSSPEIPRTPVVISAVPNPLARSFDAILKRPLFDPDRREVEPLQKKAVETQLSPPDVTLLGVIIDSERRLALVRAPDFPFATSVSEGAMISGWRVTAVEAASILLQSAAQQIRIVLNAKPPGAQGPTSIQTNSAPQSGP